MDAAVKARGCALAFVVRSCTSEIIFVASKDGDSLSAELAELEAIMRTFSFAKNNGWERSWI